MMILFMIYAKVDDPDAFCQLHCSWRFWRIVAFRQMSKNQASFQIIKFIHGMMLIILLTKDEVKVKTCGQYLQRGGQQREEVWWGIATFSLWVSHGRGCPCHLWKCTFFLPLSFLSPLVTLILINFDPFRCNVASRLCTCESSHSSSLTRLRWSRLSF